MGHLFSLFWEVDPPVPLSFTIPNEDYQCQRDDSCGTIGSFLLWYFVVILVLMFFFRASIWLYGVVEPWAPRKGPQESIWPSLLFVGILCSILLGSKHFGRFCYQSKWDHHTKNSMSEKKNDEDTGTSTSVSRVSKDTSYKWPNKYGNWDALQMMKKLKQNQLTPVTDSEMALVNAYLERRRAKQHSQLSQANQTQPDSDTTEYDSEESNSGASSWKESESETPSPTNIKKRKNIAQRQKNVESYQMRERPCLHCKALRTNEWLTRHFLQNTSAAALMKRDIQEENSVPPVKTKYSKF